MTPEEQIMAGLYSRVEWSSEEMDYLVSSGLI